MPDADDLAAQSASSNVLPKPGGAQTRVVLDTAAASRSASRWVRATWSIGTGGMLTLMCGTAEARSIPVSIINCSHLVDHRFTAACVRIS